MKITKKIIKRLPFFFVIFVVDFLLQSYLTDTMVAGIYHQKRLIPDEKDESRISKLRFCSIAVFEIRTTAGDCRHRSIGTQPANSATTKIYEIEIAAIIGSRRYRSIQNGEEPVAVAESRAVLIDL